MTDRVRAVVFDWAGTMIDFGSCAPVDAMCAAFASAGVPITPAQARLGMGRAKRDHVQSVLDQPDIAEAWQSRHGAPPSRADGDRIYAALEPLIAAAAARHTALIPGAAEAVAHLRARGVRIGSCTGYTRAMMEAILPRAAEQGYAPDALVCAGETLEGRPSPLMLWRNLVELGAWPASRCIKVDDAEVGIAEGLNAGCWTVGIAASGNGVGLDWAAYQALDEAERRARIAVAAEALRAAGAHYVIDTIADFLTVFADISARLAASDSPG